MSGLTHAELYDEIPWCFTPQQWHEWFYREQEEAAKGDDYVYEPHGFCAQCTPEHKAAMEARGDCGHPDVVFIPDPIDEDGVVGVRPIRVEPPIACGTCKEERPASKFARTIRGRCGTCSECQRKAHVEAQRRYRSRLCPALS
jgi:hypothetical protein